MHKKFYEIFKLGERQVSIISLIDHNAVSKVLSKFEKINEESIYLGLREVIRYLFLASYKEGTLFFPGSPFLDELWHALIVETAEYRSLCNKLKPGNFVDHSGVSFQDYTSGLSADEVRSEQLSWLVAYVNNFGQIDESAYDVLPVAKSLAEAMGSGSLQELNSLGKSLTSLKSKGYSQKKEFSLKEYIKNEIIPNSYEIDKNPNTLGYYLRNLIRGISSIINFDSDLLKNSEMEDLFGASTALAFSLSQHLSAVERIQALSEWKNQHSEVWKSIIGGEKICGLATTHLAKPGGAGVSGTPHNNGYLINGVAPWVCGFGIFDMLVVGFEVGSKIVFALIEFPNDGDNVIINSSKLACLNGTSTISLNFKNKFVSESDLLSSREKNTAVGPRKSSYIIPEIGIGKAALAESERITLNSSHPRHILVFKSIPKFKEKLKKIEEAKAAQNIDLDQLTMLRDQFNHEAIRLLSIAMGAASLELRSMSARMQMEVFLLDVILQTPTGLFLKIEKVLNEYV